jgi:hypothetical protein
LLVCGVIQIVARFTAVLTLCFAFGLQWIALQSVAWTSMILQNTKQTSFCRAMMRTFDGAHPCSLCHVVNKGKASQEKRDLKLSPKIDIVCVASSVRFMPRFESLEYPTISYLKPELGHSPPSPPPRTSAA